MLSANFITENKDFIVERLKVKNFDASAIVDEIIELNIKKKTIQTKLEESQASMNKTSRNIGLLFKEGKISEANKARQTTADTKELIKNLGVDLNNLEKDLFNKLTQIPNIPHESVPFGKSDEDNVEIKSGGKMPEFSETPIPHWELASKYNLIDFELGNKLTGAGFPVYMAKCAKLQRAIISFFLDSATEAGYTEVMPPIVVNEESGFGTGQLPDKEGQMYHIQEDNLYLIPTAEVPVTNIYRDVIVNEEDFPIKNTAYTPCFRREAGSYGKDVRGLNRLHQFDKVEIVQIANPTKSYEILQEMVDYVETLVQKLNLPYKILRLCGGDLSFTSALTFDFEVYSAAQDKWLEVSSISNFENYQANRLKLRYKSKDGGKPQLAHTLNGSALALPRIMAAILENNQTPEGIKVPEVLVKYTGFELIN